MQDLALKLAQISQVLNCTKNEAFLARNKKSCKKKCKTIFLQECDQILQENYLKFFSFKTFYILQENLQFSAKLVRYVQDLVQDLASVARKILIRLAYFLQDSF